MRLTPEQATKCMHETPNGRFALYDTARGKRVRPDDFKCPDVRQVIQVAQTDRVGQRSLVSLSPIMVGFLLVVFGLF